MKERQLKLKTVTMQTALIKKTVDDMNNQLNTITTLIKHNVKTNRHKRIYISNSGIPIQQYTKEYINTIQSLSDIHRQISETIQPLAKSLKKPNKRLLTLDDLKDKEFITVKEFELLYGYSAEWQSQRRSRIHNALKRVSDNKRKIIYKHSEVKDWLFNNVFK